MIFLKLLLLLVTVTQAADPWGRTFIAHADKEYEKHTLSFFKNGSYFYALHPWTGLDKYGFPKLWHFDD